MMEKWIWLPKNLYPNHQQTAYSAFCADDGTPYAVAEFKKDYSFDEKIIKARLTFSADTLFVLYLNDKVLSTGPVCVGGDYMLNDRARDHFFSQQITVYPNENALSFFARVQMRPTQLCDYSKGNGGFTLTALLTFENGKTETIYTDSSWLVRKNGAYCSPSVYDGRITPDAFTKAQEIENIWNTEIAPIPLREEYLPQIKNNKITLLPNQEVSFTAELDKIYAGFLTAKVKTDGQVHARIVCKEIDENARGENIVLVGENSYRGMYTYSAGNIVVYAKNISNTPSELEVGFIATNYPAIECAKTKTDNENLNKVLETCAHTLKICRQTIHLDSPRHSEPLACTGDYYIQCLMTAFSFGDMRLAEFDVIRTAHALEEQDGKLFHTTYSLLWVNMLWDVYTFTGNINLLKNCENALNLLLSRFKSYIGENSLIENPPNFMFVDWVMVDGFNLHHPPKALGQTVMNLFYFDALKKAEKIYIELKKHDLALAISAEREVLKNAINTLLFDKEKGCYFEGLPTPTKEELVCKFMPQNTEKRYYLKQSNALSVCVGVCDEKTAKNIIDAIMNDDIKGDCQPYFMHFLLQGIYRYSLRDKYVLKIIEKWILPVLECEKGLVEGFYPQAPNRRFDHSHAWGGTPLYSLPLSLTGLEILTPGMKEIKLSPSLLGLNSASVEFFTPYGKVTVTQEKGKKTKVTIPKSIKLEQTTDFTVEII